MKRVGIPEDSYIPLIVAVLAVLAAVLVGLLPLIHSVIGQANADRQYSTGEKEIAQQELDRIQTLQDLHAAISFAVVLLVLGLISCIVFPFLGTVPVGASPALPQPRIYGPYEHGFAETLTVILYTVAVSTSLTFFDIAKGIFEAVESYAESLKKRIRKNIGSTPEPDEPVKPHRLPHQGAAPKE
jgi:hypothetical protein